MSTDSSENSGRDVSDAPGVDTSPSVPRVLRATLVHPLTEGLRVWSPDRGRTAIRFSGAAACCLLIFASNPLAVWLLACVVAVLAPVLAFRGPSRIVTDHSGIAVSLGYGSRYIPWTQIDSITPYGIF